MVQKSSVLICRFGNFSQYVRNRKKCAEIETEMPIAKLIKCNKIYSQYKYVIQFRNGVQNEYKQ